MANVIGNGTVSQIADVDGDPITTTNRFPVETEQDDAFGTFVNYPDFAVETSTAQALNHANHTGVSIEALDALTAGDGNTGIGYQSGTSITYGQQNTSLGANSLNNNVTGNYNSAYGTLSLQKTTASNNR